MSIDNNRAFAKARMIVRNKIMEQVGDSDVADVILEKKQELVRKVAHKIIAKDRSRLKSFTHGHPLQNLGHPEGMTEAKSVNQLFLEFFPQYSTSGGQGQGFDNTTSTQRTTGMAAKGEDSGSIVQYNKFGNEKIADTSKYKSIAKKAKKSGIEEEILGEVYDRGLDSWDEGSNMTREQYAFARVNSYISGGKAYHEDSDLHEARSDDPEYDKALKRQKKGLPPAKSKSPYKKDPYWAKRKNYVEETEIDEMTDKKLLDYIGKAGKQYMAGENKKKRIKGIDLAAHKIAKHAGGVKEEVEELDEISDKTKMSYYTKAISDKAYADRGAKFYKNREDNTHKDNADAAALAARSKRRASGINRLNNEEVANGEKITKDSKKPSSRFMGSDALVKSYQDQTPCSSCGKAPCKCNGSMDEAFTSEFREEVKSYQKQPVYIPPIRRDDGTFIPSKVVMKRTMKKIIKSGNVHDGDVDQHVDQGPI